MLKYEYCWSDINYMKDLTEIIKPRLSKFKEKEETQIGYINKKPAYLVASSDKENNRRSNPHIAWIYSSVGDMKYYEYIPELKELKENIKIQLFLIKNIFKIDWNLGYELRLRKSSPMYIKYDNIYLWVDEGIVTLVGNKYKNYIEDYDFNVRIEKSNPPKIIYPLAYNCSVKSFLNLPFEIEKDILSVSHSEMNDEEYMNSPFLNKNSLRYRLILNERKKKYLKEHPEKNEIKYIIKHREHLREYLKEKGIPKTIFARALKEKVEIQIFQMLKEMGYKLSNSDKILLRQSTYPNRHQIYTLYAL